MPDKKMLITTALTASFGLAAVLATGAVLADDDRAGKGKAKPAAKHAAETPPAEDTSVSQLTIADWPKESREVANAIIKKYGEPHGASPEMLIWHRTGPWKRTIVHRDPVEHGFPVPHSDLVEQFVDYKVPTDKFDDLAAYDGSVVVARTTGELSARCDKEAMNFLAINLATDVAEGKKTVDQARQAYAETAMKTMKAMKSKKAQLPRDVRGFRFEMPDGNTADPDEPYQPKSARR